MRKYLLGNLAEEEQTQLEERLFIEKDLIDSLQMAEDDLIEEYLDDQLSDRDREDFERLFLSAPERRQRIKIARALRRQAREAAAPQPVAQPSPAAEKSSWLRALFGYLTMQEWALAAVILLLSLGLGTLLLENRRLQSQLGELASERARLTAQQQEQQAAARAANDRLSQQLAAEQRRRDELAAALAKQPTPAPTATDSQSAHIFAFVLAAGLVRDNEELPVLNMPADTTQVQLTLDLEENIFTRYRAELQNDEDIKIWQSANLTVRGKNRDIICTLPARLLSNGDYRLILRGAAANSEFAKAATYYFKVMKK